MHIRTEPSILYFGTPVVLISTANADGSYNLAPMSSAFWLGWRCILGLAAHSKTPQNMLRTRECVLNLPDVGCASLVDKLALTTGSDPVPDSKRARGYRCEKDKFGISEFTPVPSETVAPPRVKQCPVQMECVVEAHHDLAGNDAALRGRVQIFEIRVQRVYCEQRILNPADPNKVDPDRWRPLIMSFQRFYGLAPEQVHESTLGTVPEHLYRGPDIDRSRTLSERSEGAHGIRLDGSRAY